MSTDYLGTATYSPEDVPPPPPPRLRNGEKQGDLMSTQAEPLALVGQVAIDGEKVCTDNAAAEIRRQEAQAIERSQQTEFAL